MKLQETAGAPVRTETTPTEGTAAQRGLTDVLRGEMSKLTSFRTGRLGVILAIVGAAVGSAAFAATVPLTRGVEASELTNLERLQVSMLGADVTNIVLIILAILFVSGERSSGMLQLSLALSPQRGRFLLGKSLVILAPTVVLSVVSCWIAHLSGRAVFAALGTQMDPLGDPQVQTMIWGTALMAPFYVLLATACAFLFRGGITAFLGVFLVMCLPALSSLLPDAAQRAAQWVLPAPALHSFSGAAQPGDMEFTSPATVLILLVWLGAAFAAAYAAFRRVDL